MFVGPHLPDFLSYKEGFPMSNHLQYEWEVIIELRTCCHELAPPTAATMAAQARVTTDNVNNTALNLVRSND